MTAISLDPRTLLRLEQRARRNSRPLDEEVRTALLAAAASFARKRGLSSHEIHALARNVAGASVEVG